MKSLRPHFVWTLGVKGPTPEKWCSYPLHEEQRASHLARVLAIYPISLEEWERATLSELAARYPKHNALKAGERESTAARPPTLRDRLDSSARLWNQSATMLWRVSSPRHYPAGFIEPCLPTVPSKPPSGPEWIHEIKHDGYRMIVRRDGDRVRLFTRRRHDWTHRFGWIVHSLRMLRVASVTMDGEMVVCDDDGISAFANLHSQSYDGQAFLCAFDLLELNGEDYRGEPLEKRKAKLAKLLAPAESGIRLNEHLEEDALRFSATPASSV